jgi:hypothetical protein
MPTYNVTDTTTGKTLSLTGDSPPTEQELIQIFGQAQAAQPSQDPIGDIFRAGEQRRQAQALEDANASFDIGRFLKPPLVIPVVVSLILFALVLYRCFKTNKHSDPKKSSEFTQKSKTLMLKIMKILIFMGVIFCSIKLLGCFTGGHSGFYDSFDYYDGRR